MDPTLANEETLLVGGLDKELFALDPATGEQLWSEPFKGGNWFWGTPLVDGDTAYVADLDGNVTPWGSATAAAKWASPSRRMPRVRAAPFLSETSSS